MQVIKLPDAIDQILSAIQDILEDARGDELSGVRTIVLGDRARPRPDLPALWVFADPALCDHTTQGLAEKWEMPVHLVSLVDDDDPETGYRNAAAFAANANTVIVRHRRIDLPFVIDTTSMRFEPAREQYIDHIAVYAAAATIRVKFHVFDR